MWLKTDPGSELPSALFDVNIRHTHTKKKEELFHDCKPKHVKFYFPSTNSAKQARNGTNSDRQETECFIPARHFPYFNTSFVVNYLC